MQDAKQPIGHAKLTLLAALAMAQTIPVTVATTLAPAIYRELGLPLEMFAAFSLPMIVSAMRWLWAPLVDRHGAERLGRRKSWMWPALGAAALAYGAIAFIEPSLERFWVMIAALALAQFAIATLDIAYDGYTIEHLHPHERGLGATYRMVATEAGQLIALAGFLSLYDAAGWSAAIGGAALVMTALALPVLLRPERPVQAVRRDHRASLVNFLRRPENARVAAIMISAGFARGLAPAMIGAFLVDKGLAIGQIGLALGLASSLGPILAGATYAPWLARRFGIKRMGAVMLVLAPLGAGAFIALALLPNPTVWHVAALIFVATFLTAPTEIVLSAAQFGWSAREQAATDFTAQTSLYLGGRVVLAAAIAGPLAAIVGWPGFFAFIACASFASLALFVLFHDTIEDAANARVAAQS